MSAFDMAFSYVTRRDVEGEYSDDPNDPGNWTGGKAGAGELKGTKYGVSAAAYPHLDIKNLTLDECKAIYLQDYWHPIRGDDLPPELALCMFDCVVNMAGGPAGAIKTLQAAVDEVVDGKFGPRTMEAVLRIGIKDAVINFQAERLLRYSTFAAWPRYKRGWARRAIRTAMEAA